ncbi:hypothetical protein [Clostridium estertheticum]|nr:hypothetical protein [Clostridium estertheticum]
MVKKIIKIDFTNTPHDYVLYSHSERAIDITNETNIKNYIPLIEN